MEEVLADIESASRDVEGILARAGLLPPPSATASALEVQTYLRAVDAMRQARATAARNISRSKLQGSLHVTPAMSKPSALLKPQATPRAPSIITKLQILKRPVNNKASEKPKEAEPETPPKAAPGAKRARTAGTESKPFVVPTKFLTGQLQQQHLQRKHSVDAGDVGEHVHRIMPNPRIKATDKVPAELRDIRTRTTHVPGRNFETTRKFDTKTDNNTYTYSGSDAKKAYSQFHEDGAIFVPVTARKLAPAGQPAAPVIRVTQAQQPIHVSISMPKEAFPSQAAPSAPVPIVVPIYSGMKRSAAPPVTQPAALVSVPIVVTRTAKPPQPQPQPLVPSAAPIPQPATVLHSEDGTATALSGALQSMWKDMLGMFGDTLTELKAERTIGKAGPHMGVATASKISDDLVLDMLATSCMQAEQQRGTLNSRSLREMLEDIHGRVGSLQGDVARLQSATNACLDVNEGIAQKVANVEGVVELNNDAIGTMRTEMLQGSERLQNDFATVCRRMEDAVQSVGEGLAEGMREANLHLHATITEGKDGAQAAMMRHTQEDVIPAILAVADEVRELARRPLGTVDAPEVDTTELRQEIQVRVQEGVSTVLQKQESVESKVDAITEELAALRQELDKLASRKPEPTPAAAPAPPPVAELDEESVDSASLESMGQVNLTVGASSIGPYYAAVPVERRGATYHLRHTPTDTRQRKPAAGDTNTPELATVATFTAIHEMAVLEDLGDLPYLHEVDMADLSAGEVIMADDVSTGEVVELFPLHAHTR